MRYIYVGAWERMYAQRHHASIASKWERATEREYTRPSSSAESSCKRERELYWWSREWIKLLFLLAGVLAYWKIGPVSHPIHTSIINIVIFKNGQIYSFHNIIKCKNVMEITIVDPNYLRPCDTQQRSWSDQSIKKVETHFVH